ncbi:MAG: bifunctional shikimate kinase/3-dehydroquinate synthase [Anaerolineales bacterium]
MTPGAKRDKFMRTTSRSSGKDMNHIFLYGPPGSGKSSVGRVLAANLDMEFVDLDSEIVAFTGQTIPQIIAEWGESGFRDIESTALRRVTKGPPRVIALGGGALLRTQNRSHAEAKGVVVSLTAEFETLQNRIAQDATERPLLADDLPGKLARLLQRRSDHYRSYDLRVVTDGLAPEDIASHIQVMVGRFRVRGMGQPYDVIVQPGGFDGLGDLLRQRGLTGPAVIVSDENVAPLYAERISKLLRRAGIASALVTIPSGEAHKTIETVMMLWRKFLALGLDRKSTVLALGGGVVGDLAGFAAATFMRGMNWVALPSTLLAMVDASMGGKTGFDLPEGKNLVGAFHSPRLVFANPYMLSTLEDAELRSGLAEVVKHGVIADPALFTLCSGGLESVKDDMVQIVQRAMAVKVQIIEADPYEKGIRAALNFGHTVGHAIEKVSNYSIRHGEAVAMGMVAEAKLAERLWICSKGLANRIAATLLSLGLPTEIPAEFSREALMAAMRHDKKRQSGVVYFALPEEIGQMQVGVSVDNLEMVFAEDK